MNAAASRPERALPGRCHGHPRAWPSRFRPTRSLAVLTAARFVFALSIFAFALVRRRSFGAQDRLRVYGPRANVHVGVRSRPSTRPDPSPHVPVTRVRISTDPDADPSARRRNDIDRVTRCHGADDVARKKTVRKRGKIRTRGAADIRVRSS